VLWLLFIDYSNYLHAWDVVGGAGGM